MKREHLIDWIGYTIYTLHFVVLITLLGGMIYLLYNQIKNQKV
jgi:hypothetical protein